MISSRNVAVAVPRLIYQSLISIVGVRSVMANFRGRVWHVMKDVVSFETTDTQKLDHLSYRGGKRW